MPFGRLFVIVSTSAVTVALLAGCSPPAATHANPSTPATPTSAASAVAAPSVGIAATARVSSVSIYSAPDGKVTGTFANPQPSGAPLTFLVVDSRPGWLKVDLPQRPNGSTGWVSSATVALNSLVYRLTVSTGKNTLTLYKNTTVVKTFTVGTGTGGTPTPHGSFYLTELLRPTNAGYGPFAFGLSGFSNVLTSFGGGPGQIGLHGTDDATSIGRAASHGCIRMSNPDITSLAALLPLGTPIIVE